MAQEVAEKWAGRATLFRPFPFRMPRNKRRFCVAGLPIADFRMRFTESRICRAHFGPGKGFSRRFGHSGGGSYTAQVLLYLIRIPSGVREAVAMVGPVGRASDYDRTTSRPTGAAFLGGYRWSCRPWQFRFSRRSDLCACPCHVGWPASMCFTGWGCRTTGSACLSNVTCVAVKARAASA